MSEIDDLMTRVAVLETVVRQLVTHLAVRADDPPGWVETRKVLALSAIQEFRAIPMSRARDAVAGFFDPVEHVAAEYAADAAPNASPGSRR
ncbi:MAG TPA: hypothetical protein VN702_18350 [Acetobacteraceae bacterium]|nr:hypothetical protein [Acetobacteraceae bacterium]